MTESAKPCVVSVEMGYGHLRAALPLVDAFGTELLHADGAPLADEEETKTWTRVRRVHELLSRPSHLSALLGDPTRWMDRMTDIPPLHSPFDLTKPNLGVKILHTLAKRGLGRGLMQHLHETGAPLVSTFYAPAVIADYSQHDRNFCVVTDADINRVWVPLHASQSKVHYFAPSSRVVRRLQAYGVPREHITLTGFPLPLELLGGRDLEILRSDLARRLVRLDPQGTFRDIHRDDLERVLGPLPEDARDEPLHIAFAVGGAGAQSDMAFDFLPSLKQRIDAGRVKMTLIAGTRPDVARTFEVAIAKAGLAGSRGVEVLLCDSFASYYRAFNALLRTVDVLWTKPSELSFYAALGLALVLAKPVGSHERFNRRWLREQGVALKQDSPKYVDHWLEEWLNDGTLAAAAWTGYLRLPKHGTFRIVDQASGASGMDARPHLHSSS
jgi:hypothetical protein